MARRLTLVGAVLTVVVAGLVPLAVMVSQTLWVDGRLSSARFAGVLASPRQWTLLEHSLLLAVLVTVATTVVGVPLGVLLDRTDLPLRGLFTGVFVLPLIVPPYVLSVAWFHCLGKAGYLAELLGPQVGDVTSRLLFGLPGAAFVTSTAFLPVVLLLTMTYLRRADPRPEEAARQVAAWPRVVTAVSLPLVRPGILLTALLVFVLSLGEFGVPQFLRYDVFPVEVFTQFSAFYNFDAGTAASLPLGLLTLVALAGERFFLRRRTLQFQVARTSCQPLTIPLGRGRVGLFVLVLGLALLLVAVPQGVLLAQSFSGPNAYSTAFARGKDSLGRSLTYAAVGATLLGALGFLLGYLLQRRALRWHGAVDSLLLFLFALPGTVVGLVRLWNHRATNFVYGTAAIIVLGYLAKYAALSARMMAAAFSQVPDSAEEAAQIVGAGWFRRVTAVLLPLTRRGLTATWLVLFIFCLRDLGITTIVYPPAHDTLPVRLFTLMANTPAEVVAALCVIIVLMALVPLIAVGLTWRFARGVG